MKGAWIRVYETEKFSSLILTHPAKPPFALGNMALLGAKFTLDLPSTQGSEIWGEFCLDEAFLGHLCLRSFRKTQKLRKDKGAETRSAELQELPFRHAGFRDALTYRAAFHIESEAMICKGLALSDFLIMEEPPKDWIF